MFVNAYQDFNGTANITSAYVLRIKKLSVVLVYATINTYWIKVENALSTAIKYRIAVELFQVSNNAHV
jgi:hypothetical protein